MMLFGFVLMMIGFISGIGLLWTAGLVVLVIGFALWLLGTSGHAVGGRRHYY
jgi:hypothetical protein